MESPVTLVLTARIPRAGVDAFCRYEAHVLPVLAEHGGKLSRRLRGDDGCVEVHVVDFPSRAHLAGYLADRRRQQWAPELAESGATFTVLELRDAEEVAEDAAP